MPENSERAIGEVIESNTSMFVADVLRHAELPALGSWVRTGEAGEDAAYGIVCHVEQGSLMPRRRAMAFGKTSDELQREMPQVMALLQTSFKVVLVAHEAVDGSLRQTLPPHPAAIHQFVYACDSEEIQQIKAPYDFLRVLLATSEASVSIDDLLVAVLRQMFTAGGKSEGRAALLEAGKSLSRLLRDDHERLQAILRRAE